MTLEQDILHWCQINMPWFRGDWAKELAEFRTTAPEPRTILTFKLWMLKRYDHHA